MIEVVEPEEEDDQGSNPGRSQNFSLLQMPDHLESRPASCRMASGVFPTGEAS
jgi:hypothetical protein